MEKKGVNVFTFLLAALVALTSPLWLGWIIQAAKSTPPPTLTTLTANPPAALRAVAKVETSEETIHRAFAQMDDFLTPAEKEQLGALLSPGNLALMDSAYKEILAYQMLSTSMALQAIADKLTPNCEGIKKFLADFPKGFGIFEKRKAAQAVIQIYTDRMRKACHSK